MATLMCQELVELVTDYLEGSLGWRTRRRVARHLAACEACTRYVEQMRETLRVLGRIPVDTLSPQAQATLLEAFRDVRR
jgi:anti-sigma factor RsiW